MILALHSEKLLYLTATLHFLLGLQMSMFPKHKGKHRLNRGRFLGVDKRPTHPNGGTLALVQPWGMGLPAAASCASQWFMSHA